MKLKKEERLAIVNEIVNRVRLEDEKKFDKLKQKYKPSKTYAEVERCLRTAQKCIKEAINLNVNLHYQIREIPESSIENTLNEIIASELNFKYRIVKRQELENLIILHNISEELSVEGLIDNIVKSVK